MGMFESAVKALEAMNAFAYLAFVLLFILLYYFFRYALEKEVKRMTDAKKRKAASLALSALLTSLLFLAVFPYASTATTYLAAIVFVLLLFFVILGAALGLLGVDMKELKWEWPWKK